MVAAAAAIGPRACWLLEAQSSPQTIIVDIRHGIIGKGTVLGPQLPACRVSIRRRAHSVHHIRFAIERVVAEGHICAAGVIHGGQVSLFGR